MWLLIAAHPTKFKLSKRMRCEFSNAIPLSLQWIYTAEFFPTIVQLWTPRSMTSPPDNDWLQETIMFTQFLPWRNVSKYARVDMAPLSWGHHLYNSDRLWPQCSSEDDMRSSRQNWKLFEQEAAIGRTVLATVAVSGSSVQAAEYQRHSLR